MPISAALTQLFRQLGDLIASPAWYPTALLVPVLLLAVADWRIRRRR